MRVWAKDLHNFTERCISTAGASPDHAKIVADILVAADLRGVHSHGVNRLEMYVGELLHGEVNGKVTPTIINETDSIACINGNNGLGMVVGKFCMELAIKKAKSQGVGWVVARGSNHYGIAGYYAMMASEQNMMGLSFTNTSPLVNPTRSAKPALGTNPISLAAPTTSSDPFVLDMATSAVAVGKVEVHDRKESPVPLGWGCDKSGNLTTEPKEILNGGGLMPLGGAELTGGYKGYGLGMMVEILCGILSGSNFGLDIPPWRKGKRSNANLGQCFIAVNPELFAPGFGDRMASLIEQMHSLPTVHRVKLKCSWLGSQRKGLRRNMKRMELNYMPILSTH
eukprot:TRINITY_DN2023_c0_g1_i3.p1 TRINITY_DN2023_c0_g1~~TRINITY_DN2023_c0_g1_i3.p1  ORF type:complete len:339 (+),score=70.72 TRINITY_DN2023_c0_g1_i3:59-1075(+)